MALPDLAAAFPDVFGGILLVSFSDTGGVQLDSPQFIGLWYNYRGDAIADWWPVSYCTPGWLGARTESVVEIKTGSGAQFSQFTSTVH